MVVLIMNKIIKIIFGLIIGVVTASSTAQHADPQVATKAIETNNFYNVELKLKGGKVDTLKHKDYVYKNGEVNYEKVQQYVYSNYSNIKKRILFKKSDCGVMEIRHLPEELKSKPIVSLCNDVGVKSIPPV